MANERVFGGDGSVPLSLVVVVAWDPELVVLRAGFLAGGLAGDVSGRGSVCVLQVSGASVCVLEVHRGERTQMVCLGVSGAEVLESLVGVSGATEFCTTAALGDCTVAFSVFPKPWRGLFPTRISRVSTYDQPPGLHRIHGRPRGLHRGLPWGRVSTYGPPPGLHRIHGLA